jgi:hypothetical protein
MRAILFDRYGEDVLRCTEVETPALAMARY